METINILYIGKHPEIMETVVRLINKNELWTGFGTTNENEALTLFKSNSICLVLLGCGIDEQTEISLRSFFTQHNPKTKIIQHYGGGSGLLYNEIQTALNNDPEIISFLSQFNA
ncbi:hypothetical protein [Flavobacterium sp. C4GT6]|uniref:hypothetical protein n=1 Tax=Flavobacterium sp. C4GT6 TaxID=3103818 RepID=UPI002ED383FD